MGGKPPSANALSSERSRSRLNAWKWAKVARERTGAAIRADERVEPDLANAQVAAPERLQLLLDLVEFEQAIVAAGPSSLHLEVKPSHCW